MSKKVKGQKLDLATFVGPSNPTLNLPTAPDPLRQRKDVRKATEDFRLEKGKDQGWSRNMRGDDNSKFGEDDSVWRKSFGPKSSGIEERSERSKFSTVKPMESDTAEDKWSKVFKNVPDSRPKNFSGARNEDDLRNSKISPSIKRGTREEVHSLALPTAPRSVAQSSPVPTPPKIPVVVKDTNQNDKAAKALQKQEANRKAKELKEQQELMIINAAKAAREASVRAYQVALELLALGVKGDELLKHVQEKRADVTGSTLLKGILEQVESELYPWWTNGEYGSALSFLLHSSDADQVAALFVIQEYCCVKKFPKIDVKGVSRRLIEYYFGLMLSNELVDGENFVAWADDSSGDSEASLGRLDAIVQTTNFVQSVRQALLSTEEDVVDDEIDAPRETMK